MQRFSTPIVFIDIETTGFDLEDEIIQLALSRWEGGKIVKTFNQYFKPHKRIQYKAELIHGITNKILEDKDRLEIHFYEISQLLKDSIVVSVNSEYVYRLIKHICMDSGLKEPYYDFISLEKFAREFLYNKGLINFDLRTLTQFFELNEYAKNYHDSQEDVAYMTKIFQIILQISTIRNHQNLRRFSVKDKNFR